MKKLILLTLALALGASLASAQTATNAPPDRMSYQGFLVDANGNPLAPSTPVNYPVTFRIYTAATGGTRIWSESQIVTVDKGNFSVVLGEGTSVPGESSPPLSAAIANSSDASARYIQITVTINSVATDILPRLRLLPTPYAFLATSARNLTSPNGSSVVTYTNNRVEIIGDIRTSGTVSGSGGLTVPGNNVLEFGTGLSKEGNAGKIGYQTFSGVGGALDIVGAGTSGTDRKVRFYAEGGTTFSGRVGVGNLSPQKSLHIGSAVAPGSEGMIRFDSVSSLGNAARTWDIGVPETDNDTSGVGYSFIIDDLGRAGNDFIVRWDTGNVGLGTVTPSAQLSLGGALANTKLALWDNGPGSSYGIGIQPNQFRLHVNTPSDDFVFLDAPAGNELLRIRGNGSLRARPSAAGRASFMEFNDFTGNFRGLIGADGTGFSGTQNQLSIAAWTSHPIKFFTAGNERMAITAAGNVGIGTSNPASTLDVNGTITMANSAPLQGRTSSGVPEAAFWPRWADNATYLNYGNGGFFIRNNDSSVYTMTLRTNGFVGVNTTDPKAALHVRGTQVTATGSMNWFRYEFPNNAPTQDGTAASATIAYFEGQVVASDAVCSMSNPSFSDSRAKNVVGRSSGAQDLEILDRIQVTDFRWIDQTKGNSGIQKKVIAQEVEKILPNAVSRVEKAIPNVYQRAATVAFDSKQQRLSVSLNKAHEFQTGDEVDVYTDSGDLTKTRVLATPSANTFVIAAKGEAKEAFVYGKWVNDYRVVDYDAISMINVSATQEIHRKLRLQATEIEQLKQSVAELRSSEKVREARTAALEKLVHQLVQAAGEKVGCAALQVEGGERACIAAE